MVEVEAELHFAFELADHAARVSLPRFSPHAFEVESKPDGSPVTQVDRDVERLMRSMIAARRGGDVVVGEEAGRSGDDESRWRWYLDPIDGTTRFVTGDPMWMTLIAVACDGELVAGVVDYPALGERWWAGLGCGAFRDGHRLRVSNTRRLEQSVICDDWRRTIATSTNADHPLARVAAHCARVRPHQGHASLAVAAGQADIAISVGSYPWDYAAPSLIVSEAGGRCTDLTGQPDLDRRAAVVTNGQLHPQVLAHLNPSQRD